MMITNPIPIFKPYHDDKEITYVEEVIKSGWWGSGAKTEELENKISEYTGCNYAVGLNSATAGLFLALKAFNIKNKEVITTAMTFVATNHSILLNEGIPVFCDIKADTLNVDVTKLEELITDKTAAIMVVHYGGRAAEIDEIMEISRKYGIKVIEDCAHAFGADFKGRKLGSFGDFGCFSFHATKNVASGDGGMLVMNDENYYQQVKMNRWLGITRDTYSRAKGSYNWQYEVKDISLKYQMNDVNAAIALAQFEKIERLNQIRKQLTENYESQLSGIGDIEFLKRADNSRSAYHNFVIKTQYRDHLHDHLKENNISSAVHYYPNHLLPIYQKYYRQLPVTETIWKKLLTIPLYPDLTDKQIDYIVGTIKSFFRKKLPIAGNTGY